MASATSRLNDWHGTGDRGDDRRARQFRFRARPRGSSNRCALNAPGSASSTARNAAFPGCPAGVSVIPMVGTAPAAKIYALKVFPSQGGGAPESRIIAAMDRAITLRRNFNTGVPSAPVSGTGTEDDPFKFDSLNIKVVNMSLGGPTLFAGRDIEDQLTLEMLDVGITHRHVGRQRRLRGDDRRQPGHRHRFADHRRVEHAGARARSCATSSSRRPGRHRALYRPFNGVQTAYFSSRGPTADGRFDPEMSANGFAQLRERVRRHRQRSDRVVRRPGRAADRPNACASRILFVSGTSFASPTVAGAAALLQAAVPGRVGAADAQRADPGRQSRRSSATDRDASTRVPASSMSRPRSRCSIRAWSRTSFAGQQTPTTRTTSRTKWAAGGQERGRKSAQARDPARAVLTRQVHDRR